jgi:hypothetical protein
MSVAIAPKPSGTTKSISPFLTINYKWNNSTLRLFSTLTTFASAQGVALQELRIESFFPADETTRAALTAAWRSAVWRGALATEPPYSNAVSP